MNSIAHIAAILATAYLSFFAFDTLGVPLLGYAFIGIVLLFIARLIIAIQDDGEVMRGRDRDVD